MYDVIIIGGGPAGLSAAVYTVRKNLKTMLIAKEFGGQTALSSNVENYLGLKASGLELYNKFLEHVKTYNVVLKEEEVRVVEKKEDYFLIKANKDYAAKAVIIATGAKPRKLGVKGEKEFYNKGVTYCATCDAPAFFGLDVAVIGSGNSGLDAVIQLIPIANKVYLIEIGEELSGDKILQEKVVDNEKVEILTSTKLVEIKGKDRVEKIKVEQRGSFKELNARGVIINIGYIPNTTNFDIVKKNEKGEIIINEKNETSIKGVFAAGDCSSVPFKQTVIAAGEGAKAALSAFEFLSREN